MQTHAPLNRITDRCKNITLPQTSFAGGKKKFMGKSGRLSALQRNETISIGHTAVSLHTLGVCVGGGGRGWVFLATPKS